MIRRLIPSPGEADEILEDSFFHLIEESSRSARAASERPGAGLGASFEVWLFMTARRQAAAHRRAISGQTTELLPAAGDPAFHLALPWLPSSHEAGLLSMRLSLARRAMDQMPPSQRKMLDLVLFDGLTEEEAAAAINETSGKVRDHVRAAFGFVRQRLQTLMGTWTAGI